MSSMLILFDWSKNCDPHPALRATLSQWEKDILPANPSPTGRGWREAPGEGRKTGISSFRVNHRLVAFLQLLPIPFHILAAVKAQLEVLRQFKAWRRAGIFTEPAKHAARNIENIRCQDFLAGGVPVPAHFNAVLRASQGAQVTCNAKRFARFRIVI